jgi:hypothetical protein
LIPVNWDGKGQHKLKKFISRSEDVVETDIMFGMLEKSMAADIMLMRLDESMNTDKDTPTPSREPVPTIFDNEIRVDISFWGGLSPQEIDLLNEDEK